MHRERISTRNSILNTVFRRQLDGRAFLNDPDVFLLRRNNNSLTEEQKKCLAEVNALMGSVLFTSDNFFDYEAPETKEFSKILRIRNAEIISAELENDVLTLKFSIDNKKYIKRYDI